MKVLLCLFGIPALLVFSAMWRGYVLAVLWGWFFVPYLHAPTISVTVAIGISLIVGFLTHQDFQKKEEDNKDWPKKIGEVVVKSVVGPGFALLAGWIVTQFL
jgi:hypothetical protein